MDKRFVSIWFPHLTTDWFTIANPHLRGKAFVVRVPRHNRMIVGTASPVAQAAGIYEGMVLADARAIEPTLFITKSGAI